MTKDSKTIKNSSFSQSYNAVSAQQTIDMN